MNHPLRSKLRWGAVALHVVVLSCIVLGAGTDASAQGGDKPLASGSTLAAVRKRGTIRCGTSISYPGFGEIDDKGRWAGFDVDFCRAVAAAVFGDPGKVDFIAQTAKTRLDALQNGDIDILSRNTTWTLSREEGHAILFAGISYYDGQGFMVKRSLGVNSALDLSSKSICVQQDTTTELNLADFFHGRGLPYAPKAFPTAEEAEKGYRDGKCGAYTTDASALFIIRAASAEPDNNVILPQIISKEPLGPAVRQGDDQWFEIVRWTLDAMIDAEEMGVSQANVDAMAKGDNPRVKRLLGAEGNFGQALGLTADWAYRVVKTVGNYGDVFNRNLGDGSRLKIKRGLNALWTAGGLVYAAPVQ